MRAITPERTPTPTPTPMLTLARVERFDGVSGDWESDSDEPSDSELPEDPEDEVSVGDEDVVAVSDSSEVAKRGFLSSRVSPSAGSGLDLQAIPIFSRTRPC